MSKVVNPTPTLIDRIALAGAGAAVNGLLALLLSLMPGPMPELAIWSLCGLGVICIAGGFLWPDKIQNFFIALLNF